MPKIPFAKKRSSSGTPPRTIKHPLRFPVQEDSLHWRERIMFAIYLAAILLGSVSLVSSSRLAIQNGYWPLVAIYILVYLWAIIITFVRRIPFPVRAWSGLTMFYVLGLVALLTGGPGGSGRLWLFALPIVACLLLGLRAGLITLALVSWCGLQ